MCQNKHLYENTHYVVDKGSYRYSIPKINFYTVREIQKLPDGIFLYPFVKQFNSSTKAIAHANKLNSKKNSSN